MRQLSTHKEIGRLDRRITIRIPVEGRTATGHELQTYQDHATVWASKDYQGSDEDVETMRETRTDTIIWTVRYRTGINAKMIIVDHVGEQYDIKGFKEIGRKKYLQIKTIAHE